VNFDPQQTTVARVSAPTSGASVATFADAAVVQLVTSDPMSPDALVTDLHPATVTVTESGVAARDGGMAWSWLWDDIDAVVHSTDGGWTIFVVPEISDFGVRVPPARVDEFRGMLAARAGIETRRQGRPPTVEPPPMTPPSFSPSMPAPVVAVPLFIAQATDDRELITEPVAVTRSAGHDSSTVPAATLTGIDARDISAWFGSHQVLDRVSLDMVAGEVTALIGPSGCGKSTFLRILNRMHEMIPAAAMAGEVLLDGHDIYDPNRKLTDARREIGMVFQKPNPFPAMSIYDNVLASFRLTGLKASAELKDETVESCLTKAGLWNEVRDRLRQPGGGLSGGQQQRLCIARALAIKPRVLLMDEPCSALDPTSTRRIEETIMQLVSEVTIVIVTHNMQQAVRVSDQCAFFLAEQGTPGVIVEHGPTSAMFGSPQDPRTDDYVNGRFG